jgi:hypothetical protein
LPRSATAHASPSRINVVATSPRTSDTRVMAAKLGATSGSTGVPTSGSANGPPLPSTANAASTNAKAVTARSAMSGFCCMFFLKSRRRGAYGGGRG